MQAPTFLLLAAAEEGGSFLVSPSAGLVLWTLFMFLLVAALLYALVRWLRRDARRR